MVQVLFQGTQMSKCKECCILNHSCKDKQERGSLLSDYLQLVHSLVLQPLVWKEPHPTVGSQCLAAKEIPIQSPDPAIGMRWVRTFQFPGPYVGPSPKPQPLEAVENEDQGLFFSMYQNCLHVLLPAPQFRINCWETC